MGQRWGDGLVLLDLDEVTVFRMNMPGNKKLGAEAV
jgi:hypothetical protein